MFRKLYVNQIEKLQPLQSKSLETWPKLPPKPVVKHPMYGFHDIYRALSVLAEENDFIQAQLYKNSQEVIERWKDILYYNCTN